MTKMVNNS